MATLKLVPGKQERLGDQLYGQILEQIVSGVLTEGEKLPSEREICESFLVSRPVVREALLRLHADGLVMSRQGSGTYVQKRPPNNLVRLAKTSDIAGLLRSVEVRIGLEGHSAALAARRRTPQQLHQIRKALLALKASYEAGGMTAEADYDFHVSVARASGNELFVEVLEMLHTTIRHAMTVALGITREGSKERWRRVFDEHQEVYDAIASGDPVTADLAMRYHLDRARQRVTDGLKDA